MLNPDTIPIAPGIALAGFLWLVFVVQRIKR